MSSLFSCADGSSSREGSPNEQKKLSKLCESKEVYENLFYKLQGTPGSLFTNARVGMKKKVDDDSDESTVTSLRVTPQLVSLLRMRYAASEDESKEEFTKEEPVKPPSSKEVM
ncbi:unnamed protein product [Lepeophtheirus salmonis]|uniref:(salmon louse) hypothetical protein n=1 Tax=Lepeophtheirus salmonis TaxID=72036 RepID=A0A7R8GZR8_LEPSM|nr:unnamed protein product [Lepeophtheirus salmonis]CAF2771994.1 unnamed protein product [Lepeophtheirus salmonis]